MQIKRDHHSKENITFEEKLYKRPFREIYLITLRLFNYLIYRFNPKLSLILNNYFLKKKKLFTKIATENTKKNLANTSHEYYELQIGDQTRTCNILEENKEIIYTNHKDSDYFIFGSSPIINNKNVENINSWSLKIVISNQDKILDDFFIDIPYLKENRNKEFVYQSNDGWIDLKIDLKKYKEKNLRIKIISSFKKKNTLNNHFSISNPQFYCTKKIKKNILLLSMESLTDFNFLINNFNFSLPNNLKNLIKTSKYYNKTYTSVDSTLPYAASIMSGLFPSQHGIGDYKDGANSTNHNIINKNNYSLANFLKENGFLTFFSGTATRLNSKYGFARGFDYYHQINTNFENAPVKIDYLINTLDSFRDFNNFFLMHLDYLHEPIARFNDKSYIELNNISSLDKKNKKLIEKLYERGLQKIDREIGLLIDYLKKTNQYEDTLLIITGDHGASLNWVKNNERDAALYEERARVPLIIKSPIWAKPRLEKIDDIINSTTEIHKSIIYSLNKKIPDKIQHLPQFSEKSNNFAVTETIMNPEKVKERHAMAYMSGKYKYVCCNDIDWNNFKIIRKISDKLYEWDEKKYCYNEKKDIKKNIPKSEYENIHKKAYKLLNENLLYLKENPNEKY